MRIAINIRRENGIWVAEIEDLEIGAQGRSLHELIDRLHAVVCAELFGGFIIRAGGPMERDAQKERAER